MQIIPLKSIANQAVTVSLDGQQVQVNVYQKRTGLFCDVYLANALLVAGVICHDRDRIVRDTYFGLIGDLGFVDQQGLNDPDYTGLGSRYLLYYLEAADIA